MSFVGDALGFGSKSSSKAPIQASNVQADYQREALEYLKESEAIPQQYREGALQRLAGAYGLEGGVGTQQDMIDQARQSPLYSAMMGTQQAGEESILRNASATGGLRSGNVQGAMYDYNTQLENQALLASYNQQIQGLGGLAQLPSLAPMIAQQTSGIGTTLAQGIMGKAQSEAAASQAGMNNMMGIGGLGLDIYSAYKQFSDNRLKTDIKLVGKVNGHNWYTWSWNKIGESLGLHGRSQGVIADEIQKTNPEAISYKNSFMQVDYAAIGVL